MEGHRYWIPPYRQIAQTFERRVTVTVPLCFYTLRFFIYARTRLRKQHSFLIRTLYIYSYMVTSYIILRGRGRGRRRIGRLCYWVSLEEPGYVAPAGECNEIDDPDLFHLVPEAF